ncbi:DUF1007 family protein [Aestuariivirga sp.]|uniref:DUF1007 family protein n=1 Tax=Aestuariivirga sp. TaxID=2650926 RepID=UPI0035945962
MTLRRWTTAWAILACALGASGPAVAHPHVWVNMRSDVVFNDQGLITALNLMWTFDDNYAQMAIDGLDANGDGVYSPDELEPLTKENMASLKDYDYFTVMRFNGEKQALGEVTESGQIWSNDKLALHFQVPLKTPLDPTKGEFVAKVYDPDFFIAIDYVKDDPVSVIGNIPKSCKLVVKPVPTDAEVEETRAMLSTKGPDWKPENNEDFGAVFAQPVTIQCKA